MIEAVVIVSSILLALGAEALWQERTDRREEGVLLRAPVDAFLAYEGIPETHDQLIVLLKAKAQYWGAYHSYLERFVSQALGVAGLLEPQLN
ncbi:MAG: hypothetical protein KJO06_09575 [Gemmatimonadetes bacterium]|nr:hypothetical protein [Gemmatimonadota bacterium]